MNSIKPQLIHSDLFNSIGITAFFTEREGGVSQVPFNTLNFGYGLGDDENAVSDNINRLIADTKLTSEPHQATQKHGTNQMICDGEGHIHTTEADILITGASGCAVAVRTADCLPILLADPVNRIVAAVHAGWSGTAKEVVTHAINQMRAQGAEIRHIHASLGPSIGPCCFEIGERAATHLENASGQIIRKDGKLYADLAAINTAQLQKTGVSDKHIENNHLCTCCNPERFYSYRRDQGKTGRHLAVVVLPDAI